MPNNTRENCGDVHEVIRLCRNLSALPLGYRIEAGATPKHPNDHLHSTGGTLTGGFIDPTCSNCQSPLFPAFKLDMSDDRLAQLGIWNEPFLQILTCPNCCLYLKPYWLDFSTKLVLLHGGYSDSAFLSADLPYPERSLRLRKLTESEYPLSYDVFDNLDLRARKHQVGGFPVHLWFDENHILNCYKCDKKMVFAGIVDDDRGEFDLRENGQEVCLSIADADSLYFYTCANCKVIGLHWMR
jgi:hypothetical protein